MRKMIAAVAALTMLGTGGVAAAQARQERSGAPVQRMDHGPDHRGSREGGPMGGFGGMGRPSPERMFERMDANRDGSVSRAEFQAFHTRMRAMRESRGGMGQGMDRRPGAGGDWNRRDGRQVDPGAHPYPKPTR